MADVTPSTIPVIQHEKKVPLKSAIWLSFADCMCSLLCAAAEGTIINYFYVYYLHLDSKAAGIVWLLFGIWNAVNDPIYGFIADRTKNKLGRRIPWIRYGAPFIALFFILSWIQFPAMAGNQIFMAFQMAISLFFFDILYTAIASALYVMPYELAVTNAARSPIFVWKIIFSIISTGVPLLFNTQISQILHDGGYDTFVWIMVATGIFGGLIIFLSTFFYKENGYIKDEPQPKFWDGLKACLKNKSFLLFEVISFTVMYAQTSLMAGLGPAFPMWQADWPLQGNSMYGCFAALFIGAFVGVVVFAKTREKVGAKKLVLAMCAIFALGCFLGAFLGSNYWLLVVSFLMIGVGFAGGMYLIPVINGDVIDKDEMLNGSRREGTYAGVNSLITKPASALAQAAFMWIFDAFGLDESLTTVSSSTGETLIAWDQQPQSAKNGVFIAWMLVPAILILLSFVAMYFFPLDGKQWNDDKAALAKKHAEKEAAFEQEILKKQAEASK